MATFATDQGITWHDGEPFTIDDVIFSVDYMNNVLSSGYLSKVESVEKLSDTQVKMHIKDNAAYFTLGNSAVFVIFTRNTSGKTLTIPPTTPARTQPSAAAPTNW